jgi:hypothetical protein
VAVGAVEGRAGSLREGRRRPTLEKKSEKTLRSPLWKKRNQSRDQRARKMHKVV